MKPVGINILLGVKELGTGEHAEKAVEYFEWLVSKCPWWKISDKGLATAREWLRVTRADSVSPAEISALLDAAHEDRYGSHGWGSLAAGIYEWSRSRGFSVPPRAVFFATDPFFSSIPGASPQQCARLLLETFQEFHNKDPANEAWTTGIDVMQEWLTLIAAKDMDMAILAALSQRALEGSERFHVRLWGDAALGVWTWCVALGCTRLVPESFRSLQKKTSSRW
jgi:hypothetical protein